MVVVWLTGGSSSPPLPPPALNPRSNDGRLHHAQLCNAAAANTCEVYPDSPTADDDTCNRAQVAAITAALDFIIDAEGLGVC